MRSSQLYGYVLAGGKSSRMGEDKTFLQLGSQTLLELVLAKLEGLCMEIAILSGDAERNGRSGRLATYGRTVPDLLPGCGPLGGVHAALADTVRLAGGDGWALVVPVDQPFLPAEAFADWILSVRDVRTRASWLTYRHRVQPLPVLLHTSLFSSIQAQLESGERKMWRAMDVAATMHGRSAGLAYEVPDDPKHEIWFANLNEPKDFQAAQRMILEMH